VRIQIGDVTMARANYREFLSDVPGMYSVSGLPEGHRASIALFGDRWKILRIVDDIPGTWFGDFPTPQAAIAALAADLGEQELAAGSLPQPHDGVARQHEDGRWSVYQVDTDGTLRLLAGPFDRHDALNRLRTLVPVSEGDQWVIDFWGVTRALS